MAILRNKALEECIGKVLPSGKTIQPKRLINGVDFNIRTTPSHTRINLSAYSKSNPAHYFCVAGAGARALNADAMTVVEELRDYVKKLGSPTEDDPSKTKGSINAAKDETAVAKES